MNPMMQFTPKFTKVNEDSKVDNVFKVNKLSKINKFPRLLKFPKLPKFVKSALYGCSDYTTQNYSYFKSARASVVIN